MGGRCYTCQSCLSPKSACNQGRLWWNWTFHCSPKMLLTIFIWTNSQVLSRFIMPSCIVTYNCHSRKPWYYWILNAERKILNSLGDLTYCSSFVSPLLKDWLLILHAVHELNCSIDVQFFLKWLYCWIHATFLFFIVLDHGFFLCKGFIDLMVWQHRKNCHFAVSLLSGMLFIVDVVLVGHGNK